MQKEWNWRKILINVVLAHPSHFHPCEFTGDGVANSDVTELEWMILEMFLMSTFAQFTS